MSTLLLSKLQEFLQTMFLIGEQHPSPGFAHIQVPPYRSGTGDLMDSIRLALEKSKAMPEMFFVLPDVERNLLPPNVEVNLETKASDGATEVSDDESQAPKDRSITPRILTFSELLDALRTSKSLAPDFARWAEPSNCEGGRPLPIQLLLVLCLDPLMSAECALCLVGIVKWAIEATEDFLFTEIRVLTVSAEPHFNFLAKVMSFTSPGTHVAELDLAAIGEQHWDRDPPVLEKPGDQSYARLIHDKFRRNRDHKRLILSFNTHLESDFKKLLTGRENELIDFVQVQATQDARPLLNLARSDDGPKSLFISFLGEVPFQPLEIEGFHELHVVLGSCSVTRMEWEDSSCQVIVAKFPVSWEDRQLQHWWIHQPSILDRYLYLGVEDISLFTSSGDPRHRLVEGVQLGGFIASLADISSWGIDTGKTLSCFVRQTHRVHEMTLKLHAQRMLKQDRFELSGHEAIIFRAVLPALGYDYRLALLVALDAEPHVRRVKVQLAVMLKHRMSKILTFNPKIAGDSTLYRKLLKECHGLGSSMASKGVMWLSLGILKRHQKMTEQHDPYDPRKDRMSSMVQVDSGRAELVGVEVGKMLALLAENEIDVDTTQSVIQETDVLSLEAQDQLCLHLLQAYAHSLVVSEDHGESGAPRIAHRVVSTWIDSEKVRAAQVHERNSTPVKRGEFRFGICHEMFFDHNKHVLLDWTSIPAKTVGQWRSGFGRNVTLNGLLDVRAHPRGVDR